jgi:alkylated DNA nucleotide flippase Atl1
MVKAAETNLAGVLEGKKQYQVPLYQRVYSWVTPQLDQLWNDIVELAATRRLEPSATHFMGSLVLAQSPDFSVVGVSKLLVVDGQQRLTTLTLLLAALRDHLTETGEIERAEGINAQYLVNVYDRDKPAKVLPTQADRAAYLAVVRSAPDAGGSNNIGEAYNHFRAKLAAADDPEEPQDLEEIENVVVNGLALVVVTAEPRDNAHRIFESLNNTGLQLTQSDLLKNYLFMRLGEGGTNVYESVWLPLENKLSGENLELLFWLDLVQTDERAKRSDTYVGQQKRLEKLSGPPEIVEEVIRIAKLGDVLATILEPSREADEEVRRRLTRIRAWGSTTAYPVVMRILDRRAAGTASTRQVLDALTYLESYFVRRIVIGRATAGLNRTLLQAVGAIADAAEIDIALRAYLSHGRKFYGTDRQVRDAVASVPFYWQGRAAQKKLILLWLEESLGSKEIVDPTTLTIEHVLPQTLTDAVRDTFALSLPVESDVAYEHDRLVHTIGNLTLTGYNSELSNHPFSKKRDMLAESGLRLNQAIAGHEAWGAPEIAERGSDLAEKIIALWPGPDESLTGDEVEEPTSLARLVAAIVAEIPAGRWTSYGDVALVAGSYPQPVAAVITSHPMQAAWRVLQIGGTISPAFRWLDSARTEDPHDVLISEGLTFGSDGRADAGQFIGAEELAELTGLDIDRDRLRMPGERPLLAQRQAFFQRVHDLGEASETTITSWPTASTKHAVDVRLGIAGTAIVLSLSSRKPEAVFCAFYIRDDKSTYARLHSRRKEIEAAVGAELEWVDAPGIKSNQVVLRQDGDWRDDEYAPELAEWLVRTAGTFAQVFPPYLSKLG